MKGGRRENASRRTADTYREASSVRALIREVNGAIASTDGELDADVVCECGDPRCFELIPVSSPTYEEIRRRPARFLVKPGHQDPLSERTAWATPHFWVVDELPDDDGTVPELDPSRTGDRHPIG